MNLRKSFYELGGKKSSLAVLIFLCLFTGCLGPAKMNKWIANNYDETVSLNKNKSDYITVTSPLITEDAKPSKSTKRTKRFLPLLFYWKFDFQVSATLNAKIPINEFTSAFTNYANSKGLRQKLNGAKLELTINKVPVSFSFNDDNKLFYFVLFYVHTEKIYLMPEKEEMVIAYKITNNNSQIKSGILNIPDPNQIQKTRFLESIKKATGEYLSQYDDNIKAMAKNAVDKLMTEL